MNHQTFERILRFRDMPGSMRDGVLVTPLTPRCSFTCGGGICGSSRLFDGRLVAPSQALVAPSLDTSVRPRRGIRLSSIYHPAENHKFALRKGRGEAAERTSPNALKEPRDTVSITGDTHFLSLRYARRPAEFKHITKRRKRN